MSLNLFPVTELADVKVGRVVSATFKSRVDDREYNVTGKVTGLDVVPNGKVKVTLEPSMTILKEDPNHPEDELKVNTSMVFAGFYPFDDTEQLVEAYIVA
jgi:hypothetical protein